MHLRRRDGLCPGAGHNPDHRRCLESRDTYDENNDDVGDYADI
jgi:hypothetical protein